MSKITDPYSVLKERVDSVNGLLYSTIEIEGANGEKSIQLPPLDLSKFDPRVLDMSVAIFCLLYDIEIQNKSIEINKSLLPIKNLNKLLTLKGGAGDGTVVSTSIGSHGTVVIIRRPNFVKYIWILLSIFTVYFSTQFITWTSIDIIKTTAEIANIKYVNLEAKMTEIQSAPDLLTLQQYLDMYADLVKKGEVEDEVEVEVEDEGYTSSQLVVMEKFSKEMVPVMMDMIRQINVVDNQLLLPAPDLLSEDDMATYTNENILGWTNFAYSLINGPQELATKMASPYTDEIARLTSLGEEQRKIANEFTITSQNFKDKFA